jgi:Flp pilus assembly protein TadB
MSQRPDTTDRRRGLRRSYAALFFGATWIALIVAIIFGIDTGALALHVIAAALGLVALVIAFRPRPEIEQED